MRLNPKNWKQLECVEEYVLCMLTLARIKLLRSHMIHNHHKNFSCLNLSCMWESRVYRDPPSKLSDTIYSL